jgi:hypothetical protein
MFPRFTMIVAIFLLLVSSTAAAAQDPTKEKPLSDKVWDVLRGAVEIDVFQLDPTGQDIFVGEWRYLGKCTAKGPGTRKEIISALEEGVKKAEKKKNGKFEPRYGVRATSGNTTVEMVIDFELGEVRVFSAKDKAIIRTSDSPKSFFAKFFEV